MLPILLKLLLAFLCTGLLHLSYYFELDAAGYVVREQGFDIQYRTYKRDSVGRVFKEFLPSGKFKEYEYAKCGRVVKTRVSGGKIRQDSKIENQ